MNYAMRSIFCVGHSVQSTLNGHIADFFVLLSPDLTPVFPLHQIAHVGVSPSRSSKAIPVFGREIIFEVAYTSTSRTDGRTDGQTTYTHQLVSKSSVRPSDSPGAAAPVPENPQKHVRP